MWFALDCSRMLHMCLHVQRSACFSLISCLTFKNVKIELLGCRNLGRARIFHGYDFDEELEIVQIKKPINGHESSAYESDLPSYTELGQVFLHVEDAIASLYNLKEERNSVFQYVVQSNLQS